MSASGPRPGAGQGSGPRRPRLPIPPLPEEVTGAELDKEVRADLGTLPRDAAREVSRHLVMAGALLVEDPEQAYLHASAARVRAARVGVVREAMGLAAYHAGHFAEALAELRTAQRLTGNTSHLAVLADCERGLGRPERALELLASPAAAGLPTEERIELLLVAAGARLDLGDPAAAVLLLRVPELTARSRAPWLARLRSAYADALAAAGREEEARSWLERAAAVDEDGGTGAADRLAELDGLAVEEILDVELDDDEEESAEPVDSLVTPEIEALPEDGAEDGAEEEAEEEAEAVVPGTTGPLP